MQKKHLKNFGDEEGEQTMLAWEQTNKQTNRQTNKQTNKQTNRNRRTKQRKETTGGSL